LVCGLRAIKPQGRDNRALAIMRAAVGGWRGGEKGGVKGNVRRQAG